MTSALVPLKENPPGSFPGSADYFYRLGSAIFRLELWVCVTCETVVGSVEDNPACPVCTLRADLERVQEEIEERASMIGRMEWG